MPKPPTDHAAPSPVRRRLWLIPACLVAAAVGVVVALGLARPRPQPDDAPDVRPSAAPGPAPAGMVWVPGGTFWMGDAGSQDQDAPPHRVGVSGFWLDRTEVTNAEFARFVAATGYQTVAERTPTAEQYPGAKPEALVPGSAVFVPTDLPGSAHGHPPVWFKYQAGANWRHPRGPGSGIEGKDDHPVVQIAWEDADAYCKWAKKRLPTEAEWEFAARGGLDRKPYVWGDTPSGAGGKYLANTYQGRFPGKNTAADGYEYTCPVDAFPANGYGLFGMSGNAWEWCGDWYDPGYYKYGPARNPQGPAVPQSFDTGTPQRVRRGGSFLCADEYCKRYMVGYRDKNPPDSSADHTGFRCARPAE